MMLLCVRYFEVHIYLFVTIVLFLDFPRTNEQILNRDGAQSCVCCVLSYHDISWTPPVSTFISVYHLKSARTYDDSLYKFKGDKKSSEEITLRKAARWFVGPLEVDTPIKNTPTILRGTHPSLPWHPRPTQPDPTQTLTVTLTIGRGELLGWLVCTGC